MTSERSGTANTAVHPWNDWALTGNQKMDEASFLVPFGVGGCRVLRVRCQYDPFDCERAWIYDLLATVLAAPQHSYMIQTEYSRSLRWWCSVEPTAALASRASVIASEHATKPVRFIPVTSTPKPAVEHAGFFEVQFSWPPPNLWTVLTVPDPSQLPGAMADFLATRSLRRVLALRPVSRGFDIGRYLYCGHCEGEGYFGPRDDHDQLIKARCAKCLHCDGVGLIPMHTIDWLLLGGDVKPNKAVRVFDSCSRANLPVYVEQLGPAWGARRKRRHPQGEEIRQWPAEVRRRDVPLELVPASMPVPWMPTPPPENGTESFAMPGDVVDDKVTKRKSRVRKPRTVGQEGK